MQKECTPDHSKNLASRALAGILGALLGDALGCPFEFKPGHAIPAAGSINLAMPKEYRKTYEAIPYGTWSDDGSQLMCLLQTLADRQGELDLSAFAQRLLVWRHQGWHQAGGVVFDCGATTSAALERLRHGTPAEEAGGSTAQSLGNASLMRVLPVILAPVLWRKDASVVVEMALRQSRVTHAHLAAQVCCAVYAQLALLLLAAPGRDLDEAVQSAFVLVGQHPACSAPDLQSTLAQVQDVGKRAMPTGGGYVLDTFWSSIFALRKSTDYLSAVRTAIGFGNDTDTTACVTGGLAGIRYGMASVPSEWWAQQQVPVESQELLLHAFGVDPWSECPHKVVATGDGSMAISR